MDQTCKAGRSHNGFFGIPESLENKDKNIERRLTLQQTMKLDHNFAGNIRVNEGDEENESQKTEKAEIVSPNNAGGEEEENDKDHLFDAGATIPKHYEGFIEK